MNNIERVEPAMSTVPNYVVLYAIRYGMARSSYAAADARHLIEQHAEMLEREGWADQVVDDISGMLDGALRPALWTAWDERSWLDTQQKLRDVIAEARK